MAEHARASWRWLLLDAKSQLLATSAVNFTAGPNKLLGDDVINTIENSNLLLANGSLINSILATLNNPSYTLTCNTSTDVLVGLEPEFYNYTANPAYLQLM